MIDNLLCTYILQQCLMFGSETKNQEITYV